MLTWQLWREHAAANHCLEYIAFEKHPIDPGSLVDIHRLWPAMANQSQQLIDAYPLALPGCHRLHFEEGRVNLTLVWGDAAEQIALLGVQGEGHIDAWYLDGFSPRINPQLWSGELMQRVAGLTRPGGTFSTFSVAGVVRRAVQSAGFSWQKKSGFGQKGEMLVGTLNQPVTRVNRGSWFSWPAPAGKGRIAVVGGGIAGTATAYALARKQFEVTLIEQTDRLASAASGNPGGVISPFITADHSPPGRFSAAAFEYVRNNIRHLHPTGSRSDWPDWFHPVGELRLAVDEHTRQRQRRILESGWFDDQLVSGVNHQQASALAGICIDHPGIYIAAAGWVEPVAWCNALAAEFGTGVNSRFSSRVACIEWVNNGWRLYGNNNELLCEAEHLVLANAEDALRLLPQVNLPVQAMRGQIGIVPTSDQSRSLGTVLGFGHYLLPAHDGLHSMGATYDDSDEETVDPSQHRQMVRQVESVLPGLLQDSAASVPLGRVAWRATTPDRMPLVGPVSATGVCESLYRDLHLGRRVGGFPIAQPLPNLYLNIGHGSRGLVTAALSGELIASHLAGQIAPIDSQLVQALHPDRFRIRKLRSGT